MFLVDSHCHLDKLDFETIHLNLDNIVKTAKLRDVKLILSVSTDLDNFINLSKSVRSHLNKYVLLSCGIHPLYLDKYCYSKLDLLSKRDNVVAIGESGLDYYHQTEQDNKNLQQHVFREHIRVSLKYNKPIIVHSRNAINDTMAILNEEKAKTGVFHCFTEDCKIAKSILDFGFYISFSGIITFKNAYALRKVVSFVPIDRMLLETDSPYLTPEPYRGKQNQPAYLRDIAEYIAKLKLMSLDNIAITTTKNFCNLFKIKINFNDYLL